MRRAVTAWFVVGMVALSMPTVVAHAEAQATENQTRRATAECKDGSYSTASSSKAPVLATAVQVAGDDKRCHEDDGSQARRSGGRDATTDDDTV